MKKTTVITVTTVSSFLIFPFVFSFIHPWTNIQCMKQYIDTNTGMIQTQKYYWFLKYSDKIEPSFLSELLGVDSVENPQWHIVNTFSIGHRNSPHHVFHSAISQVTQFKLMVSLYNIGEQDSKAIARRIIELWKENQSDNKVGEYLGQINMQYGKDS